MCAIFIKEILNGEIRFWYHVDKNSNNFYVTYMEQGRRKGLSTREQNIIKKVLK